MSSNSFTKATFKLVKKVDYFGKIPQLYFKKKSKTQSAIGGLFTLVVLFIGILLLMRLLLSWYFYENLTIITSSESENDIDLIAGRKSKFYNMTNEIYYPYFVVDAVLLNGSSLNISDLKPYITVKMSYTKKNVIDIPLEFEPCYYRKQDLFLNKDEKTLNDDGDYQSSWSICLKTPIELGFIGDVNLGTLNMTSINFQIFSCTGESFCKNSSEIETMLRSVSIYINVPKTTYEFSNKINPENIIMKDKDI